MGVSQNHALSRLLKFYSKVESAQGTFLKPAGTDAAKVLKTDFSLDQERLDILVSRQTRSLMERCTRRATVSWSVESEIRPSGTAGTPPDIHPLLYAAFGGYTNTPATSDAYTLANTQDHTTCSMHRVMDGVVGECIWGAWCETFSLNLTGTDKPKYKFEGGAMGFSMCGPTTLDGAVSGSASIDVDDQHALDTHSIVQVGTEDNSGAGFEVTSAASRPTFTLGASVTSQADEAAVVPFGPTETTAGSALCGIIGTLSHDGDSSIKVTALDLTMANGFRPVDDEVQSQYVSDIVPGYRSVTGTMTVRARYDWIQHLYNRRGYALPALSLVIGDTAGSILTVALDDIEIGFAALDVPEGDGDVVMSLPFTALGSSGEDELTLTFT